MEALRFWFVRSCFVILVVAVASAALSGCLVIPIPIGMASAPVPAAVQQTQGSIVPPQTATVAPAASTPRVTLAKEENRQSTITKSAECKEQAEKLLSDSEKRAYMKQCMSEQR